MVDKYPLQVVINGKDAGAVQLMRRIGAVGRAQMASIRARSTSAGDAMRSLGSGLRTAATVAGGLVVAGAAAAAASAKSFADAGSELDDFRQKSGLGVEAIQAWRYATGLAGISTEVFNKGVLTFNRSLGQARLGQGKLAAGLKKTSPELLRQLKATTDTEGALALYIAAMEQIPDPSRRAALAAMAFGSAGNDMTLAASAGSEELARLRREKMRDGVMSTEQAAEAAVLGDKLDRLSSQYEAVKVSVGSATAEALEPHIDALGEWVSANHEVIGQNVASAVDTLASALRSIDWSTIGDGIGLVVDSFRAMRDIATDAKEALDLFPTTVNEMPWADKGADVLQAFDEALPGPNAIPRGPGPVLSEQIIRGLGASGALSPEQVQAAARGWLGFGLTSGQGPGRVLGEGAAKERGVQGPSLFSQMASATAPKPSPPSEVTVKLELPPGVKATTSADTTPANITVNTGRRSAGRSAP